MLAESGQASNSTGRDSAPQAGGLNTTDEQAVLATIGSRIRHLRKAQKLTQSQLVERVRGLGENADTATLSEIENGKTAANISKLVALAGALGVGIEAILVGNPSPRSGETELLFAFRTAGIAGVALWLAQQVEANGLNR